VFRTYEFANRFANKLAKETSYRLEVNEAYVPEDVSYVSIVTAEETFGTAFCRKCKTWFKPIVFATEEQAENLRNERNRACHYCRRLTIINSKLDNRKEPRNPNTAYIVLTPNEYGREDDGSVSVFRSLYAAEKHQGEHKDECDIVKTAFPDNEKSAYIVTAKHNGKDLGSRVEP
jgi:hypothetical protein